MQKEDEFIIGCARTALQTDLKQRLDDLLHMNMDWQYILKASQQHSVLPLVYHTLLTIQPSATSCPILPEMKKHAQATVARNLQMTAMLLKVLKLFSGQGIVAVPFKGPVLAEYVYGKLGLRCFGDLDILIEPRDIGRALQLLESQKFVPAIVLSAGQLSAYIKTEDDMVLQCQTSGIVIELHWEMTGRYLERPMDMDFIRPRLQSLHLFNTDLLHVSSEDLLLYLCIHGTRHMWERLEWLCSIAEIIRNKPDIRWDVLCSLARAMKCSRMLHHSLFLAHKILAVQLPHQIAAALSADPVLPQLHQEVTSRLFPLLLPNQAPNPGNRFHRLQFQVRESIGDKIKYGWRQLTQAREADWRWVRLPAHFTGIYVLLRPLRLFVFYCRSSNH